MMDSGRLRSAAQGLVLAPVWLRLGLLLAFGAASAGLCWRLVLHDLDRQLSMQASAISLDQARLEGRRAELVRSQGQLAQAQRQKEQLAVLEAELASASQAQAIWAAVHRASRKHDLRMEHFKPGPIGAEKPYAEQRAALRLSGEFDGLLAFTRSLASERAGGSGSTMAIESFSITAHPAGPSSSAGAGLVLEATLRSLYRPAMTAAPAGAATTAGSPGQAAQAKLATSDETGPSRAAVADSPAALLALLARVGLAAQPGPVIDPFASERLAVLPVPQATPSVLAKPLQSAPLSSMRMVGSVRAGEQVAALLLVGGALHAVRVGDALGDGRGKVADIRTDGLTVDEPAGPGNTKARSVSLALVKE